MSRQYLHGTLDGIVCILLGFFVECLWHSTKWDNLCLNNAEKMTVTSTYDESHPFRNDGLGQGSQAQIVRGAKS